METPNMDFDKIINEDEKQVQNTESESRNFGAVYTPDPEGNGYNCQRYGVDTNKTFDRETAYKYNKSKKNSHNPVGVIAIAVVLCILFSSAASFGTVLFTRSYLDSQETTSNIADDESHIPSETDNKIYVDKTPDYIEETVVKGSALTMEEAIKNVKDSVVEITTESVSSGFGGFSQYVVSGAGSGVIISSGGYIITNNHVIEGASNIIVHLTDGTEHKAKLIGTDSKTDIAVILITPPEGVALTPAVIGDSDSLALGQTVIAIGNPLGELGGTVTDGIISCLEREIAIDGSGTMTLLQTNAAVSPGNSGGGLFDLYGRLIGVVNAKFSGEGVEGISFAIPVNTSWDIAQQLIDKGYVSGRPSLGFTVAQVQYSYGFIGGTGYQVVVDDPKNVKDLKTNDVIVGIDNIQISTISEISYIISSHKIGDVITLTILRDRRYIEVNVTLVEYSPTDSAQTSDQNQQPRG